MYSSPCFNSPKSSLLYPLRCPATISFSWYLHFCVVSSCVVLGLVCMASSTSDGVSFSGLGYKIYTMVSNLVFYSHLDHWLWGKPADMTGMAPWRSPHGLWILGINQVSEIRSRFPNLRQRPNRLQILQYLSPKDRTHRTKKKEREKSWYHFSYLKKVLTVIPW